MKSLSPNAQEFIPCNNNNNNKNGDLTNVTPITNNNSQNTMILYLKDPNLNGGYLQYNGIQSPIAGIAKPLTISTKHLLPQPPSQTVTPNNNLNQYSIYLNQANISPNVLTTQAAPPPPSATFMFNGPQAHIIASPIAGFHSPIQPLLPQPLPQFTYNAQNISYPYTTAPPSINQYQQYQINPYQPAVQHPIQPSYIDNSNDQYSYQRPQQSVITYNNSIPVQQQQQQIHQTHQKYSNKKQNNFNRISNNITTTNYNNQKQNKNNLKKNKSQHQSNQSQTIIDNSNEREWPSLVSNNKIKEMHKSEDEDSDHKNDQENLVNIVKEPYLKDEKKLKMLLKNVNFIKTAVEQHYLNENNIKFANNNKNNTSERFSFKDAILNPRPKIDNKKNDINTEDNDNSLNKQISSSQESNKFKKSRKRSRSKKKIKNENIENTNEEPSANFDLNNEDFPDLGTTVTSTISTNLLENWKKVDHKSDAYSSDGTLDANLKSLSNTQLDEKLIKPASKNKQQSIGSKKSSQPITLEFANMITALQKGQNNTLINNQYTLNSRNQLNRPNLMPLNKNVKNLLPQGNLVNPLDPSSINKRGKEREKPKAKKHSTLKKIIIKEREEKRRFKEQNHKLDGLTLNLTGDTLTDSPLSNDVLLASPFENINSYIPNHLNVVLDKNEKKIENETSDGAKLNTDDRKFLNNSNDSTCSESTDGNKIDNPLSSCDINKDEEKNTNEKKESNVDENEDEDEDNQSIVAANTDNELEEKYENKDEDENENEEDDENEEGEEENVDPVSPISQGSPISFSGYSPSPYTALNLISNERNLISLEKLEEQVKQKIHSRKFREYCNQIINRDIDAICMSLLQEIVRFQDRLYHKNPMKAKMKRRYVMGIREVTKHLKLNKLKCIILAPNCEKIQSKGGLDDAINFIIQTSMEQNVPFVFALGRKGLGKAVNKLVPISVVGIFDYSGAEEYFKRLVELANNAKLAYQDIVEEYEKEECENLILMQSNVINNQATAESTKDILKATNGLLFNPATATNLATTMPKIPSHMAHSRTPSTGSNISIEPFFMNYHTHSRSASGNFNYGHTTTIAPGHSRSASSGGGGTLNLDLSLNKNWATHSRTPSNCSNISFISRLSEPISEVGTLYLAGSNSSINYLNTNSTLAAVQFYNEQVRQEMSGAGGGADSLSNSQKSHLSDSTTSTTHHILEDNNIVENKDNISASLANLHLGSINENDAGNEADNECENNLVETKNKRYLKKQSSSTDTTEATEEDIQKAISI